MFKTDKLLHLKDYKPKLQNASPQHTSFLINYKINNYYIICIPYLSMTNSSNFYDENNKIGLSIFTSIAIIILSNLSINTL